MESNTVWVVAVIYDSESWDIHAIFSTAEGAIQARDRLERMLAAREGRHYGVCDIYEYTLDKEAQEWRLA